MADKEFAKLDVCAADEKNSHKRKGALYAPFAPQRRKTHGAHKHTQNEYKHTQNRETGRGTDTAVAPRLFV